jgi:UDP-2-acetamido-3-amino-2,3-dideoxy-glucuronate N-acetyltransferase
MTKIHKSAEVSPKAKIGNNTSIWNNAQIRENTKIGSNCIISKGVYIDHDVKIGNNCKIQNLVSIFHGVTIENGVFIGPHVCFTNDKRPRAINEDGSLKSAHDWVCEKTRVQKGASIGANSTILPGITIGKFALIGAGSLISKNIPDHALAYGQPAKIHGYVCHCAAKLSKKNNYMKCEKCGKIFKNMP